MKKRVIIIIASTVLLIILLFVLYRYQQHTTTPIIKIKPNNNKQTKEEIITYLKDELEKCSWESGRPELRFCYIELKDTQIISTNKCILENYTDGDYTCNCYIDKICDECEVCSCRGSSWQCTKTIK